MENLQFSVWEKGVVVFDSLEQDISDLNEFKKRVSIPNTAPLTSVGGNIFIDDENYQILDISFGINNKSIQLAITVEKNK